VEQRRIWVMDKPREVHFAHARQIACLQREVYEVRTRTTRCETVYLITDMTSKQADAKRLLSLNRGHWAIENRLHYVRDMAYHEDRCRTRTGHAPRTLACLRNFALSLMRLAGVQNITAYLRTLAADAYKVLAMLRL
jgi:hypothetical protein